MSIKSGTSGKFKRSKSAGDGPPSLVVHPATEDGGGPDGDYDGDGSDSNWLQKTWRWIIEHLMMVAIALLLLGGVVFIVIYFVRKSWLSWIRQKMLADDAKSRETTSTMVQHRPPYV